MNARLKSACKPAMVAAACTVLAACAGVSANNLGPVSQNVCYQNPFFPNENHPLLTDIATGTLGDLDLEVTDIYITNEIQTSPNRQGRVLLPHEDDYIVGYTAWADVQQCEQGKVVVDFTDSCRIQQVYTRYGCQIAGVPGYAF